jgi:hypothetical protein
MVQQTRPGVVSGALLGGQAEQAEQLGLAHGRMRAEGDEEIHGFRPWPQVAGEDAEEERQRHRPRAVGHQDEHALGGQSQAFETLGDDLLDLPLRENAGRRATAADGSDDTHEGRIVH